MGHPMLSVSLPDDESSKTTPNLLPCRVQYDGGVGSVRKSYWTPTQAQDGKKRTAFFRGRKLHGRPVKVPEGYRGVVVARKHPPEPSAPRPEEPQVIDVDAEEQVPLGALETKAEFDEILIWGHESTAEPLTDPYVRGVEEWMRLAETVHSYGTDDGK